MQRNCSIRFSDALLAVGEFFFMRVRELFCFTIESSAAT